MFSKHKFALIGLLIFLNGLSAQKVKTAVFNGKTYLVYPQTVKVFTSFGYEINEMALVGLEFPPVIGAVADGEYLVLANEYYEMVALRRKKKKADTMGKVYGTFTIRNNRKEGEAYIYSLSDQKKILAVLPYKNDMLDGDVYIKGHILGYESEIFKTVICHLQYREGLMNGVLKYYKLDGKDTFLTDLITVKDGMKNGESRDLYYIRYKRKMFKYHESFGKYADGEKEGEWTQIKHNGEEDREYYVNGEKTMDKHFESGKLLWYSIYGRDSVIKHVPGYLSQKLRPYTYFNDGDYKDYIHYYRNDSSWEHYFVIDQYASEKFFYKDSRDTVIAGKIYRFSNGGLGSGMFTSKIFERIDTCYYHYNEESGQPEFRFCTTRLWEKQYNREGELIAFFREPEFNRMDSKDSLVPGSQGIIIRKHSIEERFYQHALDYYFTNYTFTKGKNKGCKIYYKVSGGYKNGSIIKYIHIPSGLDSIFLVDTLMAGGRFLYHGRDLYFQLAYASLIEKGWETDRKHRKIEEEFFNNMIYDFFKLAPVLHKTILFGNKLYKGDVDVHVKYVKHVSKTKSRVYQLKSRDPFEHTLKMLLSIERNESALIASDFLSFIIPPALMSFQVDGIFNGSVKHLDVFDQSSLAAMYVSNRLYSGLGGIEFQPYRLKPSKDVQVNHYSHISGEYRISRKNLETVPASCIQYRNGLKIGQWQLYDHWGRLSEQLTFQNDMKNGLKLIYGNYNSLSYISYMYHELNDTVNGEFWALGKDGLPELHGYFDMGVPEGKFTSYFSDDTSRYFFVQCEFDQGYKSGRFLEYRDSDNLAVAVVFKKEDSMKYTMYEFPSLEESEDDGGEEYSVVDFVHSVMDFSHARKGYFTYYYKSRTVFSHGLKTYDSPIGPWKFYREGERIYKEIDFRDSVLRLIGGDTIISFGQVKAYYDDGKLMFLGFAIDQASAYSCESDGEMPIEEDYYLEFYDSTGKQILVNGSGFISELQANGYVLKEGKIENYQKQGIWVYYSKFGLPEAVGAYKDGKKTGRWLMGDLGGLNLDEKMCFMDEEEFNAWVNTYGGDLSLEEEFYVDGELVSTNTVNSKKKRSKR